MKLSWYGHAAFLIEYGRQRIILDPYASKCGYQPINDSAEVVCVSHINEVYHSCCDDIHGDFSKLNGLAFLDQPIQIGDCCFQSTLVYEDDAQNGPNSMLRLDFPDLSIVHLGDLGHALNAEQLQQIKGCDILLALAGGAPTIALEDLRDLMAELKPAITIPMHYKLPQLTLDILPIDDFLETCSIFPVRKHESAVIDLAADRLPQDPEIWLMEPLRA